MPKIADALTPPNPKLFFMKYFISVYKLEFLTYFIPSTSGSYKLRIYGKIELFIAWIENINYKAPAAPNVWPITDLWAHIWGWSSLNTFFIELAYI